MSDAAIRGAALGLFVQPKYVRICGGGMEPAAATTDACVAHTPEPTGYVAWHEWAERMGKTHKQSRCPGCGLWAIWTPKEAL